MSKTRPILPHSEACIRHGLHPPQDDPVRFLSIPLLMCMCAQTLASEACVERATLAGSMAATKFDLNQQFAAKPQLGPTGEVWRYLAYVHAADYQQLGDTTEQLHRTAKLIATTNLAKDWRIELLVFNEFFRVLCERKMDVIALEAIDATALGACFGDTPPGKPDYAACIAAQVDRIGARSK